MPKTKELEIGDFVYRKYDPMRTGRVIDKLSASEKNWRYTVKVELVHSLRGKTVTSWQMGYLWDKIENRIIDAQKALDEVEEKLRKTKKHFGVNHY